MGKTMKYPIVFSESEACKVIRYSPGLPVRTNMYANPIARSREVELSKSSEKNSASEYCG